MLIITEEKLVQFSKKGPSALIRGRTKLKETQYGQDNKKLIKKIIEQLSQDLISY